MSITKLIRKMRYGAPLIVVSGLPRSGTSMLMKMLDAGGLAIASDGKRMADEDNPKGYFEMERVKELDKNLDKTWLKELRGKCVKIISYLLRELPTDNNYKVIFVERHLDEVIASQNKMLVRRKQTGGEASDDKMVENYRNHLWKTKYMLEHEAPFEVLYLNHRDVLKEPESMAIRINKFLGLNLEVKKMVEVVDPNLYRNRAQ
ncbi:sulfotransferase domain-containing protein [bacterium]|nr:sulfotransferase domain-containing protein [bacterium]